MLDCTSVLEHDCWLVEAHRRPRDSGATYRSPRVALETCKIDQAPPSLLANSSVVSFGGNCVGWRAIVKAWLMGRGAMLESRTSKEIEVLTEKHLPDLDVFVERECRKVSVQPSASIARAFLSILDYHFFLGSDKPSRRTISFTRAAFVYSVAWSWGVVFTPEGRSTFDIWFQERMRKAGIYQFAEHRAGMKKKCVWDYFVSFEVMDLVLLQDSSETFAHEIKVQASQGMQCAIVPVHEMRAASVIIGAHRTTGTHTLIVGDPGQGRSLLFEWMRFKTRVPDQANPTHLQMSMRTTSAFLRQFLTGAANAVPLDRRSEWGKAYIQVLIDDLHLPLHAQEEEGRGMGPVGEMLRHAIDHKGLISKGKNGTSSMTCSASQPQTLNPKP